MENHESWGAIAFGVIIILIFALHFARFPLITASFHYVAIHHIIMLCFHLYFTYFIFSYYECLGL